MRRCKGISGVDAGAWFNGLTSAQNAASDVDGEDDMDTQDPKQRSYYETLRVLMQVRRDGGMLCLARVMAGQLVCTFAPLQHYSFCHDYCTG